MDNRAHRPRLVETHRSSLDSHEVELVQIPQHQQHKGASLILPEEMVQDDLGLRPRNGSWFTWWKLELLAVTLATACMAAIIGLLLHFNRRPITSWPQTDFSLNSVVALLATLAEACLMSAVTSCIGQRKWRWFLQKSQRQSLVGGAAGVGNGDGGDRRKKLLREFEVFDDSSRGLLGSVKFFGKIGFRYATNWAVRVGSEADIFSQRYRFHRRCHHDLILTIQHPHAESRQNAGPHESRSTTRTASWRDLKKHQLR